MAHGEHVGEFWGEYGTRPRLWSADNFARFCPILPQLHIRILVYSDFKWVPAKRGQFHPQL